MQPLLWLLGLRVYLGVVSEDGNAIGVVQYADRFALLVQRGQTQAAAGQFFFDQVPHLHFCLSKTQGLLLPLCFPEQFIDTMASDRGDDLPSTGGPTRPGLSRWWKPPATCASAPSWRPPT